MKKIFLASACYCGLLALVGSMLSSCSGESLEDTYAEYVEGGEVRYIGGVTDLEIRSGWHRLMINWTNSIDPIIDQVKVVWERDDVRDSVFLAPDVTEYNITDLEDGNYSVSVQSVDGLGRTSFSSTVYGRPYTLDHETVQGVTQVVSRAFFLHDRMILTFLGWESNIDKAYVTYTPKGENRVDTLQLTKQIVNALYYLKPGEIDVEKPVVLHRSGYIPGCEDYVEFSDVELDKTRTFNGDFKREMKRQFGFGDDIPEAWADTVTSLDFDWNISSFIDLFNLPSLKTINLGKHRYIIDEMISDASGQAKQTETLLSKFVLKTLYQIQGIKVYRYNKHFNELGTATYIKSAGKPILPQLSYYDLAGNYIYFYDNMYDENWNNHNEYLTDGDVLTNWEPILLSSTYQAQLGVDLGSPQNTIHGLKWVQPYYNTANEQQRAKIVPNCQILTSIDGVNWDYATYVEDYTLGASTGETNLIYFKDGGIRARYVYLIFNTQIYSGYYYSAAIAELGLW